MRDLAIFGKKDTRYLVLREMGGSSRADRDPTGGNDTRGGRDGASSPRGLTDKSDRKPRALPLMRKAHVGSRTRRGRDLSAIELHCMSQLADTAGSRIRTVRGRPDLQRRRRTTRARVARRGWAAPG